MQGKRFATPTWSPAMRQGSYTQLHASSSSASPQQLANAGRFLLSSPREERYAYPARSRPRPAAAQAHTVNSTPVQRSQAIRDNRTQSSAQGASVHHMLNELVGLSHSIAALLEQGQMSSHTIAPSPADRQQEASLKTQEIERIVRRVEAHFADRIQSLETINAALTEEVQQLRGSLAPQRMKDTVDRMNVKHNGHGGPQEESKSLDAWNDASSDGAANGHPVGGEKHLRCVLMSEKRQRLRVEEQMQSLTEQHVKVVGTLERRLEKQEEQLYDLIAALDKGYSSRPSVALFSPMRSTEHSSLNRFASPHHLLRQHLAQHQHTQRTLQQYKENLRLEPSFPTEGDDAAANIKDPVLGKACYTLESIRSSKSLTVHKGDHDQVEPHSTACSGSPTQLVCDVRPVMMHAPVLLPQTAPPAPETAACTSDSGIDEITMFLENITRELESLDTQ